MEWTTLLPALALLSGLLTLWQWWAGSRFALHQASPPPSTPRLPVTVYKPLKGLDGETEGCLTSWLRQDYPGPVQFLFGVASAADPVCHLVERLLQEHPGCAAELVICDEILGANRKVSTLIQLERRAAHELMVISDADVSVPRDFLRRVVGELSGAGVDLISCFYRVSDPPTLAMRWEAVAVNADFWSQVLQARSLGPLEFALGAAMVTTRPQLAGIGGFEVLADYLADDFHVGRLIAARGGRLGLSRTIVECRSSPMSWAEVWFHQLRWARTIRSSRPVAYFFSIVNNATFWPTLLITAGDPRWLNAVLFVCCVGLRMISAVDLQRRLTREPGSWRFCWMVPVKDFLHVALWAMSFLGNRVTWRGERFDVVDGGRLLPLSTEERSTQADVLDEPVRES